MAWLQGREREKVHFNAYHRKWAKEFGVRVILLVHLTPDDLDSVNFQWIWSKVAIWKDNDSFRSQPYKWMNELVGCILEGRERIRVHAY